MPNWVTIDEAAIALGITGAAVRYRILKNRVHLKKETRTITIKRMVTVKLVDLDSIKEIL